VTLKPSPPPVAAKTGKLITLHGRALPKSIPAKSHGWSR
jgi:hypothetical protein